MTYADTLRDKEEFEAKLKLYTEFVMCLDICNQIRSLVDDLAMITPDFMKEFREKLSDNATAFQESYASCVADMRLDLRDKLTSCREEAYHERERRRGL